MKKKKNIKTFHRFDLFSLFFLPKTSKDKIHTISEQMLNIFHSVAKAKSSCLKEFSMF